MLNELMAGLSFCPILCVAFAINFQLQPASAVTGSFGHVMRLSLIAVVSFDFVRRYAFLINGTCVFTPVSDPSHVIGLFPDLLPQQYWNQLEYPDSLPELQGRDMESGLVALADYLTQVRCHTAVHRTGNNREEAYSCYGCCALSLSQLSVLCVLQWTCVRVCQLCTA